MTDCRLLQKASSLVSISMLRNSVYVISGRKCDSKHDSHLQECRLYEWRGEECPGWMQDHWSSSLWSLLALRTALSCCMASAMSAPAFL